MPRTRLVSAAAGAAAALLLVGLVAAQTRPQVTPYDVPPTPSTACAPSPQVTPTANVREQPREKGIDDLVAALERIKSQKADLDKAEKETAALLKEKLRQQRQRLEKLGIAEEPQHAPAGTTYYAVPVGPAPTALPDGAAPLAPPMPRTDAPSGPGVN